MEYTIRKIKASEVKAALDMVFDTFMEFEAPEYPGEGVETFKTEVIENQDFIEKCKDGRNPFYGAFDGKKVIGVICLRDNRPHLALMFVDKAYHHKGIATALYKYMLSSQIVERGLLYVTVNASPYGVPFYKHIGFMQTEEEQQTQGIRYVPMKYTVSLEELNFAWEKRIKDAGADFVNFVDIREFPVEVRGEYTSALLFGKALSKEYISDMRDGRTPKHKEVNNTEQKMDALAVKVATELTSVGYESVGKLKTGLFPHKSVALRAGLGFIGKNNLLVTPQYGCALMLGKVLTKAPFITKNVEPMSPKCGDCNICVDACESSALLDTTWKLGMPREEIMTRSLCTLCLKCMAKCPYTVKYISE